MKCHHLHSLIAGGPAVGGCRFQAPLAGGVRLLPPYRTVSKQHAINSCRILNVQVDRLLAAAGPKRHLLEGADFWSLSELADLSGGAFARMPPWLDAAAKKAAQLAAAALLKSPQAGNV